MTIYPTVLYIKQHSVTKLKYFGKTTQDPYTYNGSGKHWAPHIKKHGRKYVVTTNVFGPFTNSIVISEFALAFSKDHNIVNSDLWVNMKPENGLDGALTGPQGLRGPQQNPALKVKCPHCGLVSNPGNMKQHHFDNCKKNPSNLDHPVPAVL